MLTRCTSSTVDQMVGDLHRHRLSHPQFRLSRSCFRPRRRQLQVGRSQCCMKRPMVKRLHSVALLFYTAGLRLREAMSLTWHDIDFASDLLCISRRTASRFVQAWTPKDHELRTIPLPEQTVSLLTAWQSVASEECPYVFMESEGQTSETPQHQQLMKYAPVSGALHGALAGPRHDAELALLNRRYCSEFPEAPIGPEMAKRSPSSRRAECPQSNL